MNAKEEILFKECIGLINALSCEFYGISKEDLFQAGSLGFVKALRNYRKEKNVKFSSYAYAYIYGEMYNLVYDKNGVKINKDILKNYKLIEKTRYELAQKLGFIPDYNYMAHYLKKDIEEINYYVRAGSIIVNSLDKTSEEERNIYEVIPSRENVNLDERLDIKSSMKYLTSEEQKIINYHYFEDLPQREIARRLNMTQVMVSRYEKRGLEKIKEYMVKS